MNADSLIQLRPVQVQDLPTLFEHQCEPEANSMAAFAARSWDDFAAHWEKILADDTIDKIAVVALDATTGEPTVAGNIVAWNHEDRRLLGYWIGREFWNQGIASAALQQYLANLQSADTTAGRKLSAWVAKSNSASVRVLQKCGFVQVAEEQGEWLFQWNDSLRM